MAMLSSPRRALPQSRKPTLIWKACAGPLKAHAATLFNDGGLQFDVAEFEGLSR
jgi:hypothetical protein